MKPHVNFFFATEKDILDLVEASKQRLTSKQLRELLRSRGILVSTEMRRAELARYFAYQPHDWVSLQEILDGTQASQRRQKTSSTIVRSPTSRDNVIQALELVKELRSKQGYGESFKITAPTQPTEPIRVTVTYLEQDYGKTRLRQVVEREAEIEFVPGEGADSQWTIRRTAIDKTKEIAKQITKQLAEITKDDVTVDVIDLSGLVSAETRTRFFTDLISNMDGFSLEDVENVRVDRLPAEGDESLEAEESDDGEIHGEGHDKEARELAAAVERMILQGRSLLGTPEYQDIVRRGFFISSISWRAIKWSRKNDVYEFEASFGNPRNCSDFRYSPRGVYGTKDDGSRNKTMRRLSSDETRSLNDLLEATAWATFKSLTEPNSDDVT